MANYLIGVDIGGTFSDLVCIENDTKEITSVKVPSTPPRYIDGVMNALQKTGINIADIIIFRHSSTIAVNAVIQRKGAKTGLITTKGFKDVLEAARGDRPDIFNFLWDPGKTLVQRRNRFGVTERIDYEGNIVEEVNEEEVLKLAAIFKKRGIEAVSICFINSFMNPVNERKVRKIIEREIPGLFVCNSYDIFPEIKEFERTSSTTVNAYLGPVLDRYYEELKFRLADLGYVGEIMIAHAGGGLMTSDLAAEFPAKTCHSGPVAGVIGGAYISQLLGLQNAITLDMGGTSTDIAVVSESSPGMLPETKIEFKIPLLFPSVDFVTVGAGGGSIAWVDTGGTLKCGPHSAGAYPGPACYGLGGVEPTITDVNVILGRLNPQGLLNGEMQIWPELAREVIEKKIAQYYGVSVEEAAYNILRMLNGNMTNTIRLMLVERGYDPWNFILVASGGAGPLHAAEIAVELNIPKVVIPVMPGLVSAFGLLRMDVRHDYSRPVLQKLNNLSSKQLINLFQEMEQEALLRLELEGIPRETASFQRLLDVKYFQCNRSVTLSVGSIELTKEDIKRITDDYHEIHLQKYVYQMPDGVVPVEIVNARLIAVGFTPKADLKTCNPGGSLQSSLTGKRRVYFPQVGKYVTTSIYDRDLLPVGALLKGPAIIEQYDATILIPPKVVAVVDEYGNITLDVIALL